MWLWLALTHSLLSINALAAGELFPLPHDLVKGGSISAHHVRMKHIPSPFEEESIRAELQRRSELCRSLGKYPKAIPAGAILSEAVKDYYYTEAVVMIYEQSAGYEIDKDCNTNRSISASPVPKEIINSKGVCKLNFKQKTATGSCSEELMRAPILPSTSNKQEYGQNTSLRSTQQVKNIANLPCNEYEGRYNAWYVQLCMYAISEPFIPAPTNQNGEPESGIRLFEKSWTDGLQGYREWLATEAHLNVNVSFDLIAPHLNRSLGYEVRNVPHLSSRSAKP
jgi:hypothetical protein